MSRPFQVGKNYIPQKKALLPAICSRFENARISVMKGSKSILLKVALFHLSGHGHPQDDVMPNFFKDSKSSISGLSNEVSFVSEMYYKGG